MSLLLVLPLLIPLLTAAGGLVAWRWPRLQRALAVAGALALAAVGSALLGQVGTAGPQATQIGDWPAPFGITLVADLLGALMVTLTGLVGLAITIASLVGIDDRRLAFGYFPLLHILLLGLCGAFLTGDLFNLYVWFEVVLIASFVLLTLGGTRAQLAGGLHYVLLNLLSSVLLLAAIGLLHGVSGTLNLADLAVVLPAAVPVGVTTTLAMLFLAAFGIKAAVFPLYFWLPASYHTPPPVIAALFAGLLTKVGLYALLRTFTLLFVGEVALTHGLILVIAGATMVGGVLGALWQRALRPTLAYLIISHIGFALLGLGLYTPAGLAGAVFYLIEDVIVLTALFLLAAIIRRLGGGDELARLGGLYRPYPGLALLFAVPALSLAGIPPLSGFVAKLALIQAGLAAGAYPIVAVGLVVSLLTLAVMVRLWVTIFWRPAAAAAVAPIRRGLGDQRLLLPPTIGLAALTILLGLAAEPVFGLATAAAEQLLDPRRYIAVVLGGGS